MISGMRSTASFIHTQIYRRNEAIAEADPEVEALKNRLANLREQKNTMQEQQHAQLDAVNRNIERLQLQLDRIRQSKITL